MPLTTDGLGREDRHDMSPGLPRRVEDRLPIRSAASTARRNLQGERWACSQLGYANHGVAGNEHRELVLGQVVASLQAHGNDEAPYIGG